MANSRSARKRIRANERKHVRNRAVRSSVRTKVGKARRALVGIDETVDSQAQLTVAVSALDRAAEKGVLHPRNAARRKSRLMALAHRIEAAAAESPDALAAARAQALGGEKGRKTAGARARAVAPAATPDADEGADATATAAPKRATASKAKATTAKAAPAKAAGTAPKGRAKS